MNTVDLVFAGYAAGIASVLALYPIAAWAECRFSGWLARRDPDKATLARNPEYAAVTRDIEYRRARHMPVREQLARQQAIMTKLLEAGRR